MPPGVVMASFETNSLAGRFRPKSRVGVFARLGDSFSASLQAEKTAVVSEDGSIKVDGLRDWGTYWLGQENDGAWTTVAITAKPDDVKGLDPLERSAAYRLDMRHRRAYAGESVGPLASAAPGYTTTPNVKTGARSSNDVKGRHQPVLTEQLEEGRRVVEPDPRPAPNQVDVERVAQRSDTPFGQATPKDKREDVPAQSQEDVSSRTPQRSDTEEGTATPKSNKERQPAVRQEDVPKGTRQMSDTPEGEATPKESQAAPRGKKANVREGVEAEKRRESSSRKVGKDRPTATRSKKR